MKQAALIVIALLILTGCASVTHTEMPFDYGQVLSKEFRFGFGRPIPLTFERSSNISGCLTADGKYFIYTSNRERNNFDIYMRPLDDILTFRLTSHPAKDFAPDVSPDGKWCVFVSNRDDPEGDIFIMRLDTRKNQLKGEQEFQPKNLTTVSDLTTGAIIPVRDSDPCFSPDGHYIAFSSARDGQESIYIMDKEGAHIKKITEGTSPRFSQDGTMIIFIKRSGNWSNIYTIHLVTGHIEQITDDHFIELSPCFGKTNNDVYFMRIVTDTNNDGVLDVNDNGMLLYYNISRKEEYPLTLLEDPSAMPRWSPYGDGVIVYSIVEGKYINIAMIPQTGIIPKQTSALRQYEMALKYKEDFDDNERYKRSLLATYYFFNQALDPDSQIIVARALYELASSEKHNSAAHMLLATLAKRSKPANIYMRYYNIEEKDKTSYLEHIVKELTASSEVKLLPFFMEELADAYMRQKTYTRAQYIYNQIISSYQDYTRIMYVRYKSGTITYKKFSIPGEWIIILQSTHTYLKNVITLSIIEDVSNIPPSERYAGAMNIMETYNIPALHAIMSYVGASSLIEQGKREEGIQLLKTGLENTKKLDVSYFLINITLGKIYRAMNNDVWSVYYESAVNNYQSQWKQNLRPIIEELIEYFEHIGEQLYSEGNYQQAANIYKRYMTMVTLLNLKKRYKDIYNIYATNGHLGYINASIAVSAPNSVDILENEYLGRMSIARVDFDKAYLYGLGYIYTIKAQKIAPSPGDMEGKSSFEFEQLLELFSKALRHIDWSIFIDDMFVDAYLLKCWIYQYVDELRVLFPEKKRLIDAYFPEYLWEQNIPLYEKALLANNEHELPQKEADIHCNIANIYFLLKNYTLAARHYSKAVEFRKIFSTLKEEALFYYHYGYSLWQQGNYSAALSAMHKSYEIYKAIAQYNTSQVAPQLYALYKYFALLERMQGNYESAIAWYQTVIAHAIQYKCERNLSHIYIATAECYRELGRDNDALLYLKLARQFLPEEGSSGYTVGWKFGGIGPFYLYDLGRDAVVIGDGKVVSQFSQEEMELLIYNIETDIYMKSGKFNDAIRNLMAVVKKTEKKSDSLMRETYTNALCNIGYCYAHSGNTAEALTFYSKALDIAQKENISASTTYQILLQWSYCYTDSLLQDGNLLDNIDNALTRVEQCKKGIYDKVYAASINDYLTKAKAQGNTPSEKEISDLSKKVALQVEGDSIKFEMLSAILLMHKAHIMQNRINENNAHNVMTGNEIIQLLLKALNIFSKVLEYYSNDAMHQELIIKTLINRGVCRIELKQFREGYLDIVSARFKANSIQSKEMVWLADATLWDIATRFKEVTQFIDNPSRLIEGVLQRIEQMPPLYSNKKKFVMKLYDVYTNELISRKQYKAAYNIQQRKQVITLALSMSFRGTFHDPIDDAMYRNFVNACFTVQKLERKLVDAIQNEEKPNIIESLRNKLSIYYNHINTYRSNAKGYIAPYCGVYTPVSLSIPVIHFYEFNNQLCCWFVNGNDIEWKLLGDFTNLSNFNEEISEMIAQSGGKVYVILNDAFIKIHSHIRNTVLVNIGCVSFHSRIPDTERNISIRAVEYASGNKISSIEAYSSSPFQEEYIIDTYSNKLDISADFCYAHNIESSILFKQMDVLNTEDCIILSDAATYAKIASAILYSGKVTETVVNAVINNDYSMLDSLEHKILVLGKVIDSAEQLKINTQYVAHLKKKEYYEALMFGEYDRALKALERWKRAGLALEEYYRHKTITLIYDNKIDQALQLIAYNKIKNATISSYRIYAYILKGDIQNASRALNDGSITGTCDYAIYSVIIQSLQHIQRLPDFFEIAVNSNMLLPRNQLLLLYAQIAVLLGEEEKAVKAVVKYNISDYIPSQRELLIAHIFGHTIESMLNTRAYHIIASIANSSVKDNVIQKVFTYNELSLYAIYEIIRKRHTLKVDEWQQIMMLAQYAGRTSWLDSQFVAAKIAESMIEKNPERIIQFLDIMKLPDNKDNININHIYYIIAHCNSNNFSKAYNMCSEYHNVPFNLKSEYFTYYIYSAIMLGKKEIAKKLMEESHIVLWDNVLFSIFSINIQLQEISKAQFNDSVLHNISEEIDTLIAHIDVNSIKQYYNRYKYLIDRLFEYKISFTMSRNNQKESLKYAELHRMIKGITLFDVNSTFKSIYEDVRSNKLNIEEIQKHIQRKSALVYIIRNEDDIFVWVISRTYIQPLRLSHSYLTISTLADEYYHKSIMLQTIKEYETAFNAICKPLIQELIIFDKIIVIPDEYTEMIPYEILHFNKDATGIVFLPSLAAALTENNPTPSMVWINTNKDNRHIIETAVRQSGINYTFSSIDKGVMITDMSLNEDNTVKGNVQLNGNIIDPRLITIYLKNKAGETYYNGLYMIQSGSDSFIVFNNTVLDSRSMIFLREFCANIMKDNIINAFSNTLAYVRKDKRFKYQTYLTGIRLYCRTLKELYKRVQ